MKNINKLIATLVAVFGLYAVSAQAQEAQSQSEVTPSPQPVKEGVVNRLDDGMVNPWKPTPPALVPYSTTSGNNGLFSSGFKSWDNRNLRPDTGSSFREWESGRTRFYNPYRNNRYGRYGYNSGCYQNGRQRGGRGRGGKRRR